MQRKETCATYTVQHILSRVAPGVTRHQRILIGTNTFKNVTKFSSINDERPKRVTKDIDTNRFFHANLYHPEELPLIYEIIDTYARPLLLLPVHQHECNLVNDGSFRGFFHRGCIGHTIFLGIRQYLDVHDLSNFRDSGLDQRNEMCCLTSVTDVLRERNAGIEQAMMRNERVLIGAGPTEALSCSRELGKFLLEDHIA